VTLREVSRRADLAQTKLLRSVLVGQFELSRRLATTALQDEHVYERDNRHHNTVEEPGSLASPDSLGDVRRTGCQCKQKDADEHAEQRPRLWTRLSPLGSIRRCSIFACRPGRFKLTHYPLGLAR
jgi:hypothetical protein